MPHRNRANQIAGFTLVELLVVIFIIALLASILIPTVAKVRTSGYVASTKAFISQLDGAIQRYHQEFHAYPGPFSNQQVENSNPQTDQTRIVPTSGWTGTISVAPGVTGFATMPLAQANITASENLVLGLLGGLRVDASSSPYKLYYDPSQVGNGPLELRTAGLPTKHSPFADAKQLSWRDTGDGKTGQYADGAGTAVDSIIPEFVDSFPSALPVIYLRARAGAPQITQNIAEDNNSIITYDKSDPDNRVGQYDLHDLIPYTSTKIGEGKKLPTYIRGVANVAPAHGLRTVDPTASLDKNNPKFVYPYDAFAYFTNPSSPNVARQKDGFILISAGPDRIYGTSDDICNFGDVAP